MKRIAPLILMIIFFLMTTLHAAEKSAYFYSFEEKVEVSISDKTIAVLARDDRVEEVKKILKRNEFRLVNEYPNGLLIYVPPKLPENATMMTYAEGLQEKYQKYVARVGLVVTPVNTKSPMLLSNDFVVQFRPDAKPEDIKEFNAKNNVKVIMENPYVKYQYLLAVTKNSKLNTLDMANYFHEKKELVEYAHPNFTRVVEDRETIPNDTLFRNQWHHRNTGQAGGTVDADIDTSWAWDISQGAAGTLIAVIDSGFNAAHPDFNLWTNPGEIAGNGIDDDANGVTDDINGWDFTGCDVVVPPPPAGCGDNNVTGGNHGTSVAGTAAATGNNNLGVTGSCPNCNLILIRRPATDFAQGLAFGYAQQLQTQIITNSWGFAIGTPCATNLCTAINNAATNGRGGLGSVVLFAMNNPNVNDCTGANPDISSLANVIAVSRATNQDQFDFSGFGNCMDLLAPSAGLGTVGAGRGTLWATTTDRTGANGYNNNSAPAGCPSVEPGPPPANARDYTMCFNGTSFATPLTAGVAGLVLTASPNLTRVQVQQLLQDTADRIEDSTGAYSNTNGFSSPATGQATHGWGRVNAFEAVTVVAPAAQGGRAGVDIFLRDNRLDWGNTEQPSNTLFEPVRGRIGHWRSMDIKVDAPPYEATPPTTANFDSFSDNTPSAISGELNRAYVRVRNRGPVSAANVTVKLLWSQFGTALPALPGDFWTAFPADSTDTSRWHPLSCAGSTSTTCAVSNLAYSGSTIAGTGADPSQIVQFDFPAPAIDATLANHFCMLAIVDSPQDRVSAASRASTVVDDITPTDNNVTHRNYHNLESGDRSASERFYVRNPTDRQLRVVLRANAPEGWLVELDKLAFDVPFNLAAGKEVLVTARVNTPMKGATGEVEIYQERLDGKKPRLMGGLTLGFTPKQPPDGSGDSDPAKGASTYLVGTFDLRENHNTVIYLVNPTAQSLQALVTFFDDKERPLSCVRKNLGPNGLLEFNVREYVNKAQLGVTKVIALSQNNDKPTLGLVGNQRFISSGQVSETPLHAIQNEVLLNGEYERIRGACNP